jgi:Tol biopolymer transport system component
MNADGANPRQLSEGPEYDHTPSFSPEGAWIIFTRQADWKFRPGTAAAAESFIMRADGTGERRLTDNEEADFVPSFSPDGQSVLFDLWARDVWVMNSDGTNRRRLGPGASPAFSPDGKKVVCLYGKFARELGIMAADGSDPKVVYRSETYKSHPTFTPDGSQVLFLDESQADGTGELCLLTLGGAKVERVGRTDSPPGRDPRPE